LFAGLAVAVLSVWALDPWGLEQHLPLAVLILIVASLVGLGGAFGNGSIVMHRALWPFAGLLGWLALASARGITPFASLIGAPSRLLGLIGWVTFAGCFVLGLQLGNNGGTRRAIERALILGSLPIAVFALVERGAGFFTVGSGNDLVRSQSTLRNPVFLGAYLVLALPVAATWALDRAQIRWQRFVAAFAVLIDVAALLATQSRGPWLGGVVSSIVVLVAALRSRSAHVRSAAIVLGLLAVSAVLVSPLRDRALSIGRTDSGSNAIRVQLYSRGLDLVSKRPVFGYGPDATATALPRVLNDEFELKVGRQFEPDRIHNVELDVAVWGGLPAMLLYLGVVITIGWRSWKRRADLSVGLAAGSLGYFVQMQVSFPLADIDAVAWLLAGVLLASDGRIVQVASPISKGLRTALFAAALAGGFWQARVVGADHLLGQAVRSETAGRSADAVHLYQRAAEQAPERAQTWQALARFGLRAAARGDTSYLEASATAIQRALRLIPNEPSYLVDDLDARRQLGTLRQDDHALVAALDDALALTRSDPSSASVWLATGSLEATLHHKREAVAAWERSAFLAPWAIGPRLNLGSAAAGSGDIANAAKWFREVLALQPDEQTASAFLASHPFP
jgi:O-antigen ligase/cytochrome c-type biogenesis protein CcmH/NrfG